YQAYGTAAHALGVVSGSRCAGRTRAPRWWKPKQAGARSGIVELEHQWYYNVCNAFEFSQDCLAADTQFFRESSAEHVVPRIRTSRARRKSSALLSVARVMTAKHGRDMTKRCGSAPMITAQVASASCNSTELRAEGFAERDHGIRSRSRKTCGTSGSRPRSAAAVRR
ncbi:MAG: hypothetical protein JWN04_4059, partial [Myxococcaceae bacterium]|nr:hypothetical protein [Myxococcaceae bacterium]